MALSVRVHAGEERSLTRLGTCHSWKSNLTADKLLLTLADDLPLMRRSSAKAPKSSSAGACRSTSYTKANWMKSVWQEVRFFRKPGL